ncbi:flagella basal body P-ring formation protein FlgA [Peredibacter sp. HCB2-198]|uniref:flagella basal body P-ring formation protein FlgA n=1 Tax=Peredibacter sp. HCB2-198 TaxID=3383025 RepID=UPI0038B570F1
MKLVLILASLLFSGIALCCEMALPHHLMIISQNADLSSAIHHQNCSDSIVNEMTQILGSVEGKITAPQLVTMFRIKNQDVRIEPSMIQIQQFKQIVRDQLILPPGVQMKSSEAINAQNFISLAPGDRVEVQCIGCLYGTGQPLNVNVMGFDGNQRTLTVKADFKKMVKAYRLTSFMPAFADVPKDVLKEEYVESIPHTDLITDLGTLKFYKLNKPVKAGELLKMSDLNAINLVKAGLKTEVVIENDLVRIKTDGISRSNGTLGEIVEVFHPQKNKKYQGKVVDINKVLVEL